MPDPLSALFAELGRLLLLDRLEKELRRRGYRLVAGVDEAGRGSLAGPVVAAAVILPEGCVLPGLDDSKKLDPPSRARLDRAVRERALAVGIGAVSARDIDARDILRASLAAMKIAIGSLDPKPDVLLVDAVSVPGVRLPQIPVVRGDSLCSSIAAASVVAKVHRDRLLAELAARHPAYGFERHKGYGTPEHWKALRLYGPCPEHRLTYRGVVPEKGLLWPGGPGSFGGRETEDGSGKTRRPVRESAGRRARRRTSSSVGRLTSSGSIRG